MAKYQPNWKNYYETLQVSPNAELTVIVAAYRRLSQKYHPDVTKDPSASARMTELNEAYEVLSDPANRADYDSVFRTKYEAWEEQYPLRTQTPYGRETVKSMNRRATRNSIIVTFILMTMWAVILEFVPEGWWVLAINIVGILLTAWILLSCAVSFFKLYMPGIVAFLASGGLWVTMFVAIRFVIAIVIGFTSPISTISDNGSPQEKQEIIDYLIEVTPVMEAHADWHDDQNALAQRRGLDYDEAMTELRNLMGRMEKIYLDVEKSASPPILREFKGKWSRVCQLELQTLTLTVQSIETNDNNLLNQVNELTFEANNVKTEADEQLLDILSKYDIDIKDFSQ